MNMNMNEILANRGLELLTKSKGDYFHCNPNNHVNMSQSTNDVVPIDLHCGVPTVGDVTRYHEETTGCVP